MTVSNAFVVSNVVKLGLFHLLSSSLGLIVETHFSQQQQLQKEQIDKKMFVLD